MGSSFEDRQDLLGHKSGRITTHYSAAKIGNLVAAANKVCETQSGIPSTTRQTLMLLRCIDTATPPILSTES